MTYEWESRIAAMPTVNGFLSDKALEELRRIAETTTDEWERRKAWQMYDSAT